MTHFACDLIKVPESELSFEPVLIREASDALHESAALLPTLARRDALLRSYFSRATVLRAGNERPPGQVDRAETTLNKLTRPLLDCQPPRSPERENGTAAERA